MPLSDNEQRLLEQMERALYAEDPKFASTMRGVARRHGYLSRLIIGLLAVVIGLVVLLLGVAKGMVLIGVLGFLAMLGGTVFAFSARRRSGPTGVVTATGGVRPPAAGRKSKGSKGTFMQRMEQRWDRRRDER
ncbi:MAG: DUF3040 domain-containing protein [Kineosporiaceae bacterium]|nr:DUF3040 domain-containing protein [Kineosporiaceae bacterium]MBK7624582.1 DUF3040 domain-containing protein [Kineosporiaceae bacterium]MBK8077048.1 DUF3040 domain-containing protein [Kineosporiaceae bacterium]